MPTKFEKQNWFTQLHMPVSYAAIYVDLAAERGVSARQLLQQAKLKDKLLANAMGRISPLEYVQLIAAVVQLTGDEGLGFEVGTRQPLTAHGSLGYALLCCSTVNEAVAVLQRFWNIRGRGVRLVCSQQQELLVFDFQDEMSLEKTIHRVIFDAMLSGFYHSLRFMLSEQQHIGELWFDYSEPTYLARYSARLPTIRYDMPVMQLRVPMSVGDKRLPLGNPEALALAISQCERELAVLEQTHQDGLIAARALMTLNEQGYPLPEQLANAMHVSSRTLRRRLQMQGGSYQQLLEEARRRDALILLDKASLEIQKVAELLGYSNPANFTRAFKEWTGRTPSQYRAMRALT